MDLSTIATSIWSLIKTLFSKLTFKDWCIIILVILTVIFFTSSKYYYNKSQTPTIVYATDSLEVYKNKLNEEYIAKNTYIQTIEQLKTTNSELYNEVKNLKDNPIVVTKTEIITQIDTIYAQSDTILTPSIYDRQLVWNAVSQEGYYSLKGYTNVKTDFSEFSTVIHDLNIPAELTLDVIEQDNQLKVIAKTNNPYVVVSDLSSVVIDPTQSNVIKSQFKQKRWGIGPQFGIGVDRNLKFTPYLGIGVTYSLWQF